MGTPHPDTTPTRAMVVGQHLILIVLTLIGAARATTDGTPLPLALTTALILIGWHSAGRLLLHPHGTPPHPNPDHRAPGTPGGARIDKQTTTWFTTLTLLWAGAIWVSPEFVWVAFALWLLAGHTLPMRWGLPASVLIFAGVITAPLAHHGTITYASVIGPLVGGICAYGISRGYLHLLRDATEREQLLTTLTRAYHDLTTLQDELAHTQRQTGAINERTRIARDIHDTIAQNLSSIRLIAHAAADTTTNPNTANTLTHITNLATTGQHDVRRIIAALTPHELDNTPLTSALTHMLERTHTETGITTHLHIDDSLPTLPAATDVALLRTAQSALANVRTHSHATTVHVSLTNTGDTVRLDITDNGRGFSMRDPSTHAPAPPASSPSSPTTPDTPLTLPDASPRTPSPPPKGPLWLRKDQLFPHLRNHNGPHTKPEQRAQPKQRTQPEQRAARQPQYPAAPTSTFGLRFMRDRLTELGGGLDIESAPGEGTAISMYLPLTPADPSPPATEEPR